jgi:hypothetical protein
MRTRAAERGIGIVSPHFTRRVDLAEQQPGGELSSSHRPAKKLNQPFFRADQ